MRKKKKEIIIKNRKPPKQPLQTWFEAENEKNVLWEAYDKQSKKARKLHEKLFPEKKGLLGG